MKTPCFFRLLRGWPLLGVVLLPHLLAAQSLSPLIAENAGGDSVAVFRPDTSFGDLNSSNNGLTYRTSATIATAGVRNAAPAAVYQTERYGNPGFTYTLAGLTPDGAARLVPGVAYLVRLHFAEIYFTQPGERQFNVSINGQAVLTDFDIVTAAGGANKAVVREFTALAQAVRGGPGVITVRFTQGAANLPKLSAIEVLPATLFIEQKPTLTDFSEGRSYELGTPLQASANGQIRAIRYWKALSDAGPHVGKVWSASGELLASATFAEPVVPAPPSGWQQVELATPVAITAGQTYTVSVNSNTHYVATVGGLSPAVARGYLSSQGAGTYGDAGTFPTSSYQSSNYFRDVVFVADGTTTITPPPPTVVPALSLFTTQEPTQADVSDGQPYELGTKFRTSVAGAVEGLRYWKAASDAGPHVGRLWTAAGQLLDSVVFVNETTSGWQQAALPAARRLATGTTYVVTVNVASHFAISNSGLSTSVQNGPLSTVADGANGVYGPAGRFPANSYQSSNYFRDVVFRPDSAVVIPPPPAATGPFVHRGYLGWVRDLASEGRPNATWPAIDLDAPLKADYDTSFDELGPNGAGLNETTIWGFFASREWSVDVENTIDAVRAAEVRTLIDRAHAKGLKVFVGLGVYSWGFEGIIRQEPGLSDGQNLSALCASNPRSWYWQKRVIDYVFSFPIDGVSLQSADQGRCRAPQDANLSDLAYHALLNDSVAGYIKRAYPGKTVGINGYGIYLTDPALVAQLTRHADYLIDVQNVARQQSGRALRRALITAIAPCAYGTLGAPFNEPPQHWDRERWFLPQLRRAATGLQELYADGGRAAENFMRPLANPGEEASIKLLAAVELNPATAWPAQLRQVLQTIYAPTDTAALTDLTKVFLGAEDAYFDNSSVTDIISLEPLISNQVGPPVYLRDRMNGAQLASYGSRLCALRNQATGLLGRVGNVARLQTVIRCLGRALDDVNSLTGSSACPGGAASVVAGTGRAAATPRLAVYPNPVRTRLTVRAENLAGATLTLTDAYGRRVRSVRVTGADPTATLPVEGLAEGLYYLRLQPVSGASPAVQKVVIQH